MTHLPRRTEDREENHSKREMYDAGRKAGRSGPSKPLTMGMELRDLDLDTLLGSGLTLLQYLFAALEAA